VLVPFTWKVTGWFMIGWSPEFPIGEVRPLHYFGEDLVAYRDEHGQLHVLDAHCKLSKVDAKGCMALRKWATQFYEVPA
jgi:phenylpropionate dioxygenase-like ring-hydroxylating dioxygenase large terminal subunit